MSHRIYTCWATTSDDLSAPWMIWACDEYHYEADPGASDAELAAARTNLGEGFAFREITVLVSYESVVERFEEGAIDGTLADA